MTANTQFDAIVVGSGVTGGWAAKELTEKGLRVLVLERGRHIEHGKDYVGEHMPPWKIPYGGMPPRELYAAEYAVQSTCYAFDETTRHFWNNDRDNPYTCAEGKPFRWIRANVLGGRSLLWGRQVYRWSDLDFDAHRNDGHGIDWPIRYDDLRDWYTQVERFIGVSGQKEDLPQLPDGEFLPPMAFNAAELHFRQALAERYPDRRVTIGRTAVLTQIHNGRAACHYCGVCQRGCSTGSYFTSLSSTLPAAAATGRLTIRTDSVVEGLDYDPKTRRVTAVRVVDANTKARQRFSARVVFLCASTVGSVQILLNSRSESFPLGLANRSGVLGRYVMDHHNHGLTSGLMPEALDVYPYGLRPNGIYIPRFRNLSGRDAGVDFDRGYGYQGLALRADWRTMAARLPGFGAGFKQALRNPGPWIMLLGGFGECLPRRDNRIELHERQVDRYGIPLVRFDFAFGRNEELQRADMQQQAEAMLSAAGAINVSTRADERIGGSAIHEMGGARMGRDPAISVLNAHNQAHDIANLFVTDGACMTSSSCVNPSITYMALTARAADYAVTQLQANQI